MVVEPKDIKSRGKFKNKRGFFRLNERLRIEVKAIKKSVEGKLTGETKVERTGKVSEYFTNDISAGGLQYFSHGHYRENIHVEITFYFKDTEPHFDPITVKAKILRAEQVENSQYYNVSVMYIDMDAKDRSQIERYIFV